MNFFDLHCDTVYELNKRSLTFDNDILSVKKTDIFEKHSQIFALWIKDGKTAPYSEYKALLKCYNEKVLPFESDRFKPILAIEGGAFIENRPERVFYIKNDGAVYLTLTWNGKNTLASGVDESGTVTEIGKRTVQNLNACKIACDLSHLNRESFFDVLKIAEYPIVSHTASYEIFAHKRNIDDRMALSVKGKGGIIGLSVYPDFLGKGNVYENFKKHLCHFLSLGLQNQICIGTDFDGAETDRTLNTLADIKKLYAYLLKNGFDRITLDNIFYKNAQNYFFALTK